MWKETDLVQNNTFLLSIPSVQLQKLVTCKLERFIFTARKRSLQRLCFHRCLSVHGGGAVCPIACWDTHPQDQRQPPPQPEADTPLRTSGRHPLGRHPPADTPSADTSRFWPDPPGRHPLHSACWDTVNKRAVRIPL